MEFKHTSVLYQEVLENLNIKENGIYVDGTLGGAGHGQGVCEKLSPKGIFIGIDRDDAALEASKKRLEKYSCKKYFVKSNYADIKSVLDNLQIEKIDGALLDLGVSSFQLDNGYRGFSYMQDAPLDMRMDESSELTAKTIVNTYSEKELTRIISNYGEERWATRISKFIVEARNTKEIETTGELTEIIKKAIPMKARKEGPHPAKRTFQAIRIEVNQELELLGGALEDFCDKLNTGGRFCVITFHSLEDRITKKCFNGRENPCICPSTFPVCTCGKEGDIKIVSKKPIVPSKNELNENHRARSAKLRVAEKRGDLYDASYKMV